MVTQQSALPAAWRSLARPIVILALVVIGVLIARRIPLTLEVVVVAMLLAYGMNPLIAALSKRMPRRTAIVVVFAGLIIGLLVIALLVIPAIVLQMQNLFSNAPSYLSTAQTWFEHARVWFASKFRINIAPSQIQQLSAQHMGDISSALSAGLGQVGLAVMFTADAIVVIFTAVVFSYYLLANANAIKQGFLDLFPQRYQADALRFTQELERVFGGYISGQIILSLFCALFSFLGLKLAGANFALLLGALTGFLYAIPYIGVASAIILGALFGLLQSWQVALLSAIIIFIVTRISDTLLVPKVMSKSVGVSPMAIMLAVLAGGEMFGLWGLVLAIPVTAILKVAWIVWLRPWLVGEPQGTHQSVTTGGLTDATKQSSVQL